MYKILAVVIFIIISSWGYIIVYDNNISNFGKTSSYYIYPGTSPDSLVRLISENGKVKSMSSLKRAFGNVKHIKPGHYVIKEKYSSNKVRKIFTKGMQTPVRLTIAGSIRKNSDLAKRISRQTMSDSAFVADKLSDENFTSAFGFRPQEIFAMILPDTYEIYWDEPLEKIFGRLKKQYDKFWSKERTAKADSLNLTKLEVSILASIVDEETNYVPEMPAIASVYLNRLKKGMKLQADPTVAYCFGFTLNRILKIHLSEDSPYNTYLNFGLPPGPVCVPSADAINAVLNPCKSDYLYFCASDEMNGKHNFSSSYTVHLRNAAKYRKALLKFQKKP